MEIFTVGILHCEVKSSRAKAWVILFGDAGIEDVRDRNANCFPIITAAAQDIADVSQQAGCPEFFPCFAVNLLWPTWVVASQFIELALDIAFRDSQLRKSVEEVFLHVDRQFQVV